MLYSVFNVSSKNLLHTETSRKLRRVTEGINLFDKALTSRNAEDEENIKAVSKVVFELGSLLSGMKGYPTAMYAQSIKLSTYKYLKGLATFTKYLEGKQGDKILLSSSTFLASRITEFLNIVTTPDGAYTALRKSKLKQEIQENFQVSNIGDLISYNKNVSTLTTEGFGLSFNTKNTLTVALEEFVTGGEAFTRVVFFDSPSYWSIMEALNSAKEVKHDLDLTGVPKHFYDLVKILCAKSRRSSLEVAEELAATLKDTIKGEFIFESGRVSFISNTGRSIDKNMVSLGTTNLGMLQALLKNNILDKGSVMFFDSPETGLHPTWQILLSKVLIKLAENGVIILIVTHSPCILKELKVYSESNNASFIAVNHLAE